MVLPAKDINDIKLVSIPEDFDERDAHRHVTALIASIQETDPDYSWEDLEAVLEEHGFDNIEFELGPDI